MEDEKAIELLEEYLKSTCINGRHYVVDSLAFLRAKPPAGEFTKSKRSWIKMNSFLKDYRLAALATSVLEACYRLDRADAENKKLKDALAEIAEKSEDHGYFAEQALKES